VKAYDLSASPGEQVPQRHMSRIPVCRDDEQPKSADLSGNAFEEPEARAVGPLEVFKNQ
jgi:hypothetical protein